MGSLASVRPRIGFVPGALALIAPPFIGRGGWPSEEIADCAGLAGRLPAGMPVFLHHGSEDRTVPLAHAGLYAKVFPQAVVRVLRGRDHQLDNDLGELARDIVSLRLPRSPAATSPADTGRAP